MAVTSPSELVPVVSPIAVVGLLVLGWLLCSADVHAQELKPVRPDIVTPVSSDSTNVVRIRVLPAGASVRPRYTGGPLTVDSIALTFQARPVP